MSGEEDYIEPETLANENPVEEIAEDVETADDVPPPNAAPQAYAPPLSQLPPPVPRFNKDGTPSKKRGPKPGRPRTKAQEAALLLAQTALKDKREAIRELKEEEKRLIKEATICKAQAKKVFAQGKMTDSLTPILSLMHPFLELSRTQAKEIEHLRTVNSRNMGPRRGTGRGAGARYDPYGGEGSTTDFSEDDARQLERPSQKKHHTRSATNKPATNKSRRQVEPESAPESDFVEIQRAPPAPSPLQQQTTAANNAAAASLARFMNDLGY
jgi:hypothetical protein